MWWVGVGGGCGSWRAVCFVYQCVLCIIVMYVFVLFVCVDLLENEMMHLKGPSEIKLKLKSANLHPSLFEHPLLNPSDWAKKAQMHVHSTCMHACTQRLHILSQEVTTARTSPFKRSCSSK